MEPRTGHDMMNLLIYTSQIAQRLKREGSYISRERANRGGLGRVAGENAVFVLCLAKYNISFQVFHGFGSFLRFLVCSNHVLLTRTTTGILDAVLNKEKSSW